MERHPAASVSASVSVMGVYNADELKQRFVHVWHGIDQTITDNATDEWRGRLRDCVRAKGGYFEQML